MKQHIVPTSPKSPYTQERAASHEKSAQHCGKFRFRVITCLAMFFFACIAGCIGFFLAVSIPPQWPVIGKLSIAPLLEGKQQTVLLSTAQRTKSVVEESPQVIEQMVTLYDTAPVFGSGEKIRGNAVILTSDGWCVTPMEAFHTTSKKAPQPIVLLSDGSTATITSVVDDPVSELTFFQLDASQLSPVVFSDVYELPIGHWVTVIEQQLGSYEIFERRVSGMSYRPTQEHSSRYSLDTFGEVHRPGAGVFSNDGQLMGVIDAKGDLLQSSAIRGQLESLLQDATITTLNFDFDFIPVQYLTQKEKEERGMTADQKGILITEVESTQQILASNDSIVSINNVLVTETTDMAGIFRSQPVGTTFVLGLIRNGENITVEYTTQELAK